MGSVKHMMKSFFSFTRKTMIEFHSKFDLNGFIKYLISNITVYWAVISDSLVLLKLQEKKANSLVRNFIKLRYMTIYKIFF
jgi:hypothetical protein